MPRETLSEPTLSPFKRKFSRRSTLGLGAGALGALTRPGRAQGQEVTGTTNLEAPLSPIDALLANTELVDALYLGETPIAEFRTTPDAQFQLTLGSELPDETRASFAEFINQSGQKLGYKTAEFVTTSEKFGDESSMFNEVTYTYQGKRLHMYCGASIDNERLFFLFAPSQQIMPFLSDPVFVDQGIGIIRAFARRAFSQGDLSYDTVEDPSLLSQAKVLINQDTLQVYPKIRP